MNSTSHSAIRVRQRVDNETPRERADRHQHEREQGQLVARPWKIALGLSFAIWVLALLWFNFQRDIRPRVVGLDSKLYVLRCLTGSAFLWVLLIMPLSRLGAKLMSLFAKRKQLTSRKRAGGNQPDSEPTQLTLLETSAWLLPCMAATIAASLLISFWGIFVAMGSVSLLALVMLLPWAPVIFVARRAFPKRNELVMVTMLLFLGTGIAQSIVNRGFYSHSYSTRGVRFVIPHKAADLGTGPEGAQESNLTATKR